MEVMLVEIEPARSAENLVLIRTPPPEFHGKESVPGRPITTMGVVCE